MNLFVRGPFISHSGKELDFKIECDALSNEDIETCAYMISKRVEFSNVVAVPRGGVRLRDALFKYRTDGPLLIVDDVLTTGRSLKEMRHEMIALGETDIIGYVIFARGPMPDWVNTLFTAA